MTEPLPIARLITGRCRELGLSRSDLVGRCGYRNVAKGLRRLDDLCAGNLHGTDWLIRALLTALGLDPAIIESAMDETRAELRARADAVHRAAEAEYRETFVPHGVILTEREVPQPIFVAAFIGVNRLLRIDLDTSRDRSTFPAQAFTELNRRTGGGTSRPIPAFGNATGFVVNFMPDRAVRFDLDGHAVEVLPQAARLAEATFVFGGQPHRPLVDYLAQG